MNISLTKEENELIKKIAKEEHRPYSRQIVYMTYTYIKNKEKEIKRNKGEYNEE